MKKNSLIPALTGVLLVLAVFLAVATYATIQFSRRARSIQSEVAMMNFTKLNVDALVRETVAYSQTNHTVDSILLSIGISSKPGQLPSATKTPAR